MTTKSGSHPGGEGHLTETSHGVEIQKQRDGINPDFNIIQWFGCLGRILQIKVIDNNNNNNSEDNLFSLGPL